MREIKHLSYQYQVLATACSLCDPIYKVCLMSPHTHNQNLDQQYVALLKFPRVFSFSIFFEIEMSKFSRICIIWKSLLVQLSVVSVLLMELSLNLFDFRI